MKCSACQLKLITSPREHYKSDIHKLNVQRQIYEIPHITVDEYMSAGHSSDCSLDINLFSKDTDMVEDYTIKLPKFYGIKQKPKICLLCEKVESHEHYKSHTLKDDDISKLINKKCYICDEVFTNKPSLRLHLQSGDHRNVLVYKDSLKLESGKVLFNKSRNNGVIEGQGNISKDRQILHVEDTSQFTVNNRNVVQKNTLKVSLQSNVQKHYRPDWMQ